MFCPRSSNPAAFESGDHVLLTPRETMRRGIFVGFVLTLAVLIGNAVFAILNTRKLVETGHWVVHTHEVLRQLEATQTGIADAIASQRTYLLTQDEATLHQFRVAAAQTAEELRRLRQLVHDSPVHQERLLALEPTAQQALLELGRQVDVFRTQGADAAQAAVVATGEGAAADARRLLHQMEDDERVLLVERGDESQTSVRWALLSFALATALALTAMIWEFDAVRKDIRRREAGARDLRDQREQFRITLASIADGVIVTDVSGLVTFVNPVAAALTGWADDAIGRPLQEVFAAVDEHTRRPIDNVAAEALRAGTAWSTATPTDLIERGGTARPIDLSAAPLRNAAGAPVGAVLAFRDVTDRRRADDSLREQAALLAEATDAILVEDTAGRVTYWNRGAERLYGWPAAEARGRDVADLLHGGTAADRIEALAAVAAKGEWAGELRQRKRDGQPVIIASRWTLLHDAAGRPRSRLVINVDVTESKKLEAQFLRAQRLESIGTLAGGIAHDLNNVLTPILMGLDILRSAPNESHRLGVLDTLQAAAQRGADLVKQVLLFSRGADGLRGVLSLKPLMREVEGIITHTFPKGIVARVFVAPDLWPAPVDATQFTQVLMNLAVNARDAMSAGGDLHIRAENLTVDDHYAGMHVDARPGRYVAVSVSDTGEGILPEVQARMFDPFFTTKPPGLGTGLGLSTLLGIVQGHGGFVNVYSEPGRGARFVVCFPAAKVSEDTRKPMAMPLQTGDGELILVVDDEAAIAQITRHTLEAHGYQVVTAADGAEALELFRLHAGEVRAVLTDMMMPVMDGPATIRAIRQLDGAVPFIAASGLSDPFRASGDATGEVAATLPKPFTAEMLLKVVRKVLVASPKNGKSHPVAAN
jgi:two-component system cell cycle sensor histidine kinase/response regulator CckA